MKNSKTTLALKYAYEMGYKITKDGNVISPKGNILSLYYKQKNEREPSFTVKFNGENMSIPVHRLGGYQKFGSVIFNDDICVFRKDGDHLNNKLSNITKGTFQQSQMAKPKDVRVRVAAQANKKHDHAKILEMYKDGSSYKKIMEATGIKSKGTISFIINKSMDSK